MSVQNVVHQRAQGLKPRFFERVNGTTEVVPDTRLYVHPFLRPENLA
jgi:hypothetical protein